MNFLNVLADASNGVFNNKWAIWDVEFWIKIGFTIVYNIICGVLQIIYTLESVFYYLAGIGNLKQLGTDGLGNILPSVGLDSDGNIDWSTLGNSANNGMFSLQGKNGINNSLGNVMLVMASVGISMVVIFLIYACVKGLFNQEGKTEGIIKLSLLNTIKACCFIVIIPMLIPIIIATLNTFIAIVFIGIGQLLGNTSSGDGYVSNSIAYQIYSSLFNKSNGNSFITTLTSDKIYQQNQSNFYDKWYWEENSKYLPENWGYGVAGASPYYIHFISIENLSIVFNMQPSGEFAYVVGFFASGFTLVAIGLLTIRIAERLFELLINYVLVIPVIATMPLDNGERFRKWTELFTGHLINFTGSVICMLLYSYVVSFVYQAVNVESLSKETGYTFFKMIVICLTAIGGGFTCVKAGNIVAQLIGQSAGQAEANSLSQSMQLSKMGMGAVKTMALGGAGILGAYAVNQVKNSAWKKKYNNNNSGDSGGTGGGSGKASLASLASGTGGTPSLSGEKEGSMLSSLGEKGSEVASGTAGASEKASKLSTMGTGKSGGVESTGTGSTSGGTMGTGTETSSGKTGSDSNISAMRNAGNPLENNSISTGNESSASSNGSSNFKNTLSKLGNGALRGVSNYANMVRSARPRGILGLAAAGLGAGLVMIAGSAIKGLGYGVGGVIKGIKAGRNKYKNSATGKARASVKAQKKANKSAYKAKSQEIKTQQKQNSSLKKNLIKSDIASAKENYKANMHSNNDIEDRKERKAAMKASKQEYKDKVKGIKDNYSKGAKDLNEEKKDNVWKAKLGYIGGKFRINSKERLDKHLANKTKEDKLAKAKSGYEDKIKSIKESKTMGERAKKNALRNAKKDYNQEKKDTFKQYKATTSQISDKKKEAVQKNKESYKNAQNNIKDNYSKEHTLKSELKKQNSSLNTKAVRDESKNGKSPTVNDKAVKNYDNANSSTSDRASKKLSVYSKSRDNYETSYTFGGDNYSVAGAYGSESKPVGGGMKVENYNTSSESSLSPKDKNKKSTKEVANKKVASGKATYNKTNVINSLNSFGGTGMGISTKPEPNPGLSFGGGSNPVLTPAAKKTRRSHRNSGKQYYSVAGKYEGGKD